MILKLCFLVNSYITFLSISIVTCSRSTLYPKDKILDWSKLKAFADDKINVIKKNKFALARIINIVGNGEYAGRENAGYQHILLFLQFFQKVSFRGSLTLSQTSPGFYVSEVQVF